MKCQDHDYAGLKVLDRGDAVARKKKMMKKTKEEVFGWGPFKCYVSFFFPGNWTPTHRAPRNTNNIEPYTCVTFFPENLTPPPPSALRNT